MFRAIAALLAALCVLLPQTSFAQASEKSRADIIRALYAEESAARIDMPLGGEGVQLTAAGTIDQPKLQKEIQKNGASIRIGRIVQLTGIEFGSKSIGIELDGGGKAKKNIAGHVQITVGGGAPPAPTTSSAPKARGSKITLQFAGKVPEDISADQLKQLLAPILDFTKHTVTSANIESLPPEFKQAVLAKEAAIGMDVDTVLLALGRPDHRTSEKVGGVEQETWEYRGLGVKRTFVTFESNIVVSVREY